MRRHFAGYIAFGVALWMGLQSCISIGVNLGALPTKGLTLPLISSGGSSVLMTCVVLGILLRVSWEYERAIRQVAKRRAVADGVSVGAPPQAAQPPLPAEAVHRSAGRQRQRVEPQMGQPNTESAALAALRRAQ